MTSKLPIDPAAVAQKARGVAAKLRPGPTDGRRSLPIRRTAEEVRRLWSDDGVRAATLEGLPVGDSFLEFGPDAGEWGTTVTLHLRLDAPVPGMATQVLAGKAIRRLKSLAETGEVPTTDHNPSARDDTGEAAA